MVSAYLAGLQRKENMPSISVTFFTKLPSNFPPRTLNFIRDQFNLSVFIILAALALLASHRITLDSKDLLTSVNSILTALNLPTVEKPKEAKQTDPHHIQFKIIEIEKFYDFTKIPKVSIEYVGERKQKP